LLAESGANIGKMGHSVLSFVCGIEDPGIRGPERDNGSVNTIGPVATAIRYPAFPERFRFRRPASAVPAGKNSPSGFLFRNSAIISQVRQLCKYYGLSGEAVSGAKRQSKTTASWFLLYCP